MGSKLSNNWDDFSDALDDAKKKAVSELEEEMRNVVEEVRQEANRRYPFSSKPVSAGVSVDSTKVRGFVGATLERAEGARYYSHNRWEASDEGRPLGLFWELGFRLVYFGHPTGKRLGPRPFLVPAFEAKVKKAKYMLGEAFISAIGEAFPSRTFNRVLD